MRKASRKSPGKTGRAPGEALRALLVGPPRYTLSAAESVTCGGVQVAIGAFSGASEFFVGGMTAYTLEQKVRHLAVDVAEAERTNGVSALIAAQMATGACRFFRTEFAVATTGFAEPNPALGFKIPTAFWAVARSGGDKSMIVREGVLRGRGLDRVAMQQATADVVLRALVDVLRAMRMAAAKSNFA